ncbi:hypothetical protein F4802DRAFT_592768 [Xylaria palmicola]|nr:hypothetical protein F4802DRAFT_592768 [Xylaria palmicola]
MPIVLAINPFPQDTEVEISRVAEWLLGPNAIWFRDSGVEICINRYQILGEEDNLTQMFKETISGSSGVNKVVVGAIHFKNHTEFPIPAGWQVDLIPLHEVAGVTVDGQELNSKHHARLGNNADEDALVTVSGNFYGLVFSYRF